MTDLCVCKCVCCCLLSLFLFRFHCPLNEFVSIFVFFLSNKNIKIIKFAFKFYNIKKVLVIKYAMLEGKVFVEWVWVCGGERSLDRYTN